MIAFWDCAGLRQIRFHKVITLGDLMKLLTVGDFVDHFAMLCTFGNFLNRNCHEMGLPVRWPDPISYDLVVRRLRDFKAGIDNLHVPISKRTVDEALVILDRAQAEPNGARFIPYGQDLASLNASFTQLTNIFGHELEGTVFYSVTAAEAELIKPVEPHWGPEFRAKFPSAVFDVDEAAACAAFGRGTATVFHSMRVMEIGIAALAKCLGIPDPVRPADKNWGAIARTVQTEIRRRNAATPPTWNRPGDREFFEDAYTRMEAVRSAWRNPTMHPEKRYAPEDALEILNATRTFMRAISSRLDEAGDPPA